MLQMLQTLRMIHMLQFLQPMLLYTLATLGQGKKSLTDRPCVFMATVANQVATAKAAAAAAARAAAAASTAAGEHTCALLRWSGMEWVTLPKLWLFCMATVFGCSPPWGSNPARDVF